MMLRDSLVEVFKGKGIVIPILWKTLNILTYSKYRWLHCSPCWKRNRGHCKFPLQVRFWVPQRWGLRQREGDGGGNFHNCGPNMTVNHVSCWPPTCMCAMEGVMANVSPRLAEGHPDWTIFWVCLWGGFWTQLAFEFMDSVTDCSPMWGASPNLSKAWIEENVEKGGISSFFFPASLSKLGPLILYY